MHGPAVASRLPMRSDPSQRGISVGGNRSVNSASHSRKSPARPNIFCLHIAGSMLKTEATMFDRAGRTCDQRFLKFSHASSHSCLLPGSFRGDRLAMNTSSKRSRSTRLSSSRLSSGSSSAAFLLGTML